MIWVAIEVGILGAKSAKRKISIYVLLWDLERMSSSLDPTGKTGLPTAKVICSSLYRSNSISTSFICRCGYQ